MELWLDFLLKENLIFLCVIFCFQISHAVHCGIQVHITLVNSHSVIPMRLRDVAQIRCHGQKHLSHVQREEIRPVKLYLKKPMSTSNPLVYI